MNDEKADTIDQAVSVQDPSLAEEPENTDTGEGVSLEDEELALSDRRISCEDLPQSQALPEDPLQDPDPASSLSGEGDPQAGLEQLRGELTRLREELAQKELFWARIGEECDEFRTLYPNVSLQSLPDTVWEDAKRGIPIAAAYALAEKRRLHTEALAAESNRVNQARSSGSLAGTENEYFSPAEVRAMSSVEVRENYQKIMLSMQKWH